MRTTGVLSSLAVVGMVTLVSSVARADEPASSSTAATVTTTTTTTKTVGTAPANVPPGTVLVHLDTPAPVSLEHRQGEQGTWQTMCASPCDVAVPAGDEYRVTGAGMNDSKPFLLKSGEGQRITLEVEPGKHSKEVAGLWIIGGGAVAAIAGTVTILVGSNGADPFPHGGDGTTTDSKNTNIILVGTGLIVGGVVAAVLGGAWAIDNAHTRVGAGTGSNPSSDKATSPSTPTENPSSNGSTIVSWRQPTYVEPQAQKMTAGMQTYTFPLFSKTF